MRSQLAAVALLAGLNVAACTYVDAGALSPPPDGDGGDGDGDGDGSGDGDGDGDGASGCVVGTPSTEVCNGLDDDCDGEVDGLAADLYCEQRYLNSVTLCDDGNCIPLACRDGFRQCDGDPSNGCEPTCQCTDTCDADAGY